MKTNEKITIMSLLKKCAFFCTGIFAVTGVYAQTMAQYATLPKMLDNGVSPMVMLAMSRDHQLYFKAYTDYDDLDEIGEPGYGVLNLDEATYSNDRDYAGYFSPKHCYSYVDGVFTIAGLASSHLCEDSNANEGGWSGNFLNWATMTRIDVLRAILYGGSRKVDDADRTVLERSYLPNDAHSFAKYYGNLDNVAKLTPFTTGITICNTTLHVNNQASVDNVNAPLMRIISGNYAFWASGERHQCLAKDEIPANSDFPGSTGVAYTNTPINVKAILDNIGFTPAAQAPATKSLITDRNVRVEACPAAYAADIEGCSLYSDAFKPEGLLQQFGIPGTVKWALMTGSYTNNKTGGVLRKNFDDIASEVNEDGTFTREPDNIFSILDSFRISQWRFAGNNDGTSYNQNCKWGVSSFAQAIIGGGNVAEADLAANQKCNDWGNPIGEILAESYRYFAGAAAPSNGNASDARSPEGVAVAEWKSLNTANDADEFACANLNVFGLNSGAQTFDNNIEDFLADIGGSPNAAQIAGLTKRVGDNAGVTNNYYFLGSNGAAGAELQCEFRVVRDLSDAQGVCPDAPRKQGSWNIAGLANFVSVLGGNNRDINPTLGDNQTVRTHGVQLSSALPQLQVGNGVTLSPFCESRGNYKDENTDGYPNVDGNCALVDFRVLSLTDTAGIVYVNWEDSEQGGDFDQDMHGLIFFERDGSRLTVKTQVIGQSTPARLGFGYVISGVLGGRDGIHVYSGINGYNSRQCDSAVVLEGYDSLKGTAIGYDAAESESGLDGCGINNERKVSNNLSVPATGQVVVASKLLKSPLEYAADASCGKFVKNNNPGKLKSDLERVINSIGTATPSGGGETAASLTTGNGPGLYMHTLYYARRETIVDANGCNQAGDTVSWVGQVGALFMDNKKRLREDTVKNGNLDNDDLVVKISSELDALGSLIIRKYTPDTNTLVSEGNIDDIKYIWTTTQVLDEADPANRNIFTRIVSAAGDNAPVNTDAVIDENTGIEKDGVIAFEVGSFTGTDTQLLGQTYSATTLIDYIRGNDTPDVVGVNDKSEFRSRTLGTTQYLLGDVLTSPLIQGPPDYSYFSELGDSTYNAYIAKYGRARNVVYVASNDGMIHAFNAGVQTTAGYDAGGDTYALGEELWAYIPFNLLPHLQWLGDKNYQHVPYFDGYMRTFDIKAFKPDDVHPGGWGTILVVGTGLGGGEYPIDFDANGANDLSTRPAYVILDITNRDAKVPTLIAEISHQALGFTVGEPDIVRFDERDLSSDQGANNGWFLVFGSGPRGYDRAGSRLAQLNYETPDLPAGSPLLAADASIEKPRLFALKFEPGATAGTTIAALQEPYIVNLFDVDDNAFISAINGMDWDRDFRDDSIYFGTVGGSKVIPTGQLMRAELELNNGTLGFTPSVVINAQKPITTRPITVIDFRNEYWVFAGTGRYFVNSDTENVNSGNMFFGIKDTGATPGTVTNSEFFINDLLATNKIKVAKGGIVDDPDNNDHNHIDNVRNTVRQKDGWVYEFRADERQHAINGYLASTLYVSTTIPSNLATCENVGDFGYLYIFDMRSGVFSPNIGNTGDAAIDELLTVDSTFNVNGSDQSVTQVSLPLSIPGGAIDANNPASGIAVGTGSQPTPLPPPEFNLPSQRHSWREVTVPW